MRNMLLITLLCATTTGMAQSLLFRSYDAYTAKQGEAVDGLIDIVPQLGRFTVTFEKDGRRKHVPTRKVWGFMNNGALYRIEQEGKLPVRLMAQGAIFYWENGLAHLRMQRDSTEASGFEYGYAAYLSRDLQSIIVPAVFKPDDTKSISAKFKAAWPAYNVLLEQIGEGNDMEQVRQLVVEYEVAVEEGRMVGP
jgi:hypothetical protein